MKNSQLACGLHTIYYYGKHEAKTLLPTPRRQLKDQKWLEG